MAVAPRPLTNQPTKALDPSGASDLGSRKIPAPIIVPTTSAPVIQGPILPSLGAVIGIPPTTGVARAGDLANANSGGLEARRVRRRGAQAEAHSTGAAGASFGERVERFSARASR